MSSIKTSGKKKVLIKKNSQTRWAPFWTVPKKYGRSRVVHPGRHTTVKRNWRKTKIKD
jgi:ribosomal protein L39E